MSQQKLAQDAFTACLGYYVWSMFCGRISASLIWLTENSLAGVLHNISSCFFFFSGSWQSLTRRQQTFPPFTWQLEKGEESWCQPLISFSFSFFLGQTCVRVNGARRPDLSQHNKDSASVAKKKCKSGHSFLRYSRVVLLYLSSNVKYLFSFSLTRGRASRRRWKILPPLDALFFSSWFHHQREEEPILCPGP